MDTKSKTVLLITFGLVGAFILGAMTATFGIAMTRVVAGVMADGPAFVHGGSYMGTDMHGRYDMPRHMEEQFDRRGPGMRQWDDDGIRGPRGMMPGPRGDFDGWHPRVDPDRFEGEADVLPEDVRYGAECPAWGMR